MDYVMIGQRIKNMRRLKRLTQSELSEKMGVSLSFLGHVERGTRVMSIETLTKLACTLNCSADYLLGIASVEKSAYELALEHIREWIQAELSAVEENFESA